MNFCSQSRGCLLVRTALGMPVLDRPAIAVDLPLKAPTLKAVYDWTGSYDFLAAGGLGLLIGDGKLNDRPERILETYYAHAIDKNFKLTADYQPFANPAYNADRGPVSIFSGRLHGEF
jgi:hypothetical protein